MQMQPFTLSKGIPLDLENFLLCVTLIKCELNGLAWFTGVYSKRSTKSRDRIWNLQIGCRWDLRVTVPAPMAVPGRYSRAFPADVDAPLMDNNHNPVLALEQRPRQLEHHRVSGKSVNCYPAISIIQSANCAFIAQA